MIVRFVELAEATFSDGAPRARVVGRCSDPGATVEIELPLESARELRLGDELEVELGRSWPPLEVVR